MKKSCVTFILIFAVLGLGTIYFAQNPKLCGYSSDLGTILPCECLGIKVKSQPDNKNIINGSLVHCYGFTKSEVCKNSGNANVDSLRKELCK